MENWEKNDFLKCCFTIYNTFNEPLFLNFHPCIKKFFIQHLSLCDALEQENLIELNF